jgi:hypothetical protein
VTASQEGEGSSLRAAKGKGRDRDPTYGGETDGGGADGLDSGASTDIEQQKGDRRDVKVKIEGTGMGPETDGIDGNSLMMDVPRGNEGIEGVEANFGQLTMGDEPGQSRYFGSGSASAYLLVRLSVFTFFFRFANDYRSSHASLPDKPLLPFPLLLIQRYQLPHGPPRLLPDQLHQPSPLPLLPQ